ncbi:GGDEF domain-containing protein [Cellulomonas sp. APG4]|uniref:GGDEF domain-containing protein n=1 Tax=Cellulomonas sp. APG4 TaxID=1538656 RepID=UPI00137A8BC9|nr:GGDEF domain-containing protein [Cellulomonas sp. APG4]NCT91565.1 GGDEF domain-containing protein [Cellulomonas sp. APG4]
MARPASPTVRSQTRALAVICALTGMISLAAVVLPYSPTSPLAYWGSAGGVLLAVATALLVGQERIRPWHLHAALVLLTLAVTAGVALSTTPSGVVMTAICFLWIAAYSAVQHSPRVLARYLVAIAVGLAVALGYADAFSPVLTWLLVVGTYAAVAVVLNRTVQALRREASTDPLTGTLNRRAFTGAVELAIRRARRTGGTVALATIDLDDFKAVNDVHGHAAGDAVLVDLTRAWQQTLPPEGSLGRLGGDEFAILLPQATADDARVALAALAAEPCGWSAGVAQWDGHDVTALLHAADVDLYAAKVSRG